MDFSRLELRFISGEQSPHVCDRLFKIAEAGWPEPHCFYRTISKADAHNESFRRELFKRRVRAGNNGSMSCQWIRDAGANPDLGCVQRDGRHVHVRFAPDQMRIADPHMTVAEVLTELCKPDHFRERFRGEASNAKVQRAHDLSSVIIAVRSGGVVCWLLPPTVMSPSIMTTDTPGRSPFARESTPSLATDP